ncbi:TetR/AcrR family transcriptional regulator [Streptomyces sp. NPDC087440]|uniref:TetR/AcrR family transcriptional regulator n=1 Tax=Streptomyces sp. NPDC087440 TaxID=3365790 RepID=UPI003819A144
MCRVPTRDTVLRTAIRAFAARGYYGTTTTEAAKAAGISQAYVYRLFPDKQALFVAVIEHCASRMREGLADGAADAAGADPASVLDALKRAYGPRPPPRSHRCLNGPNLPVAWLTVR